MKHLLIVDASVVRAAGTSEHPVSKACRNCLEDIRHICHSVAVTPEINEEWENHESRFSRKWQCSMAARRKPLRRITATKLTLYTTGLSEKECAALEKDRCLLEAAETADKIIVTLDDALHNILAKTPQNSALLKRIKWINPVKDHGDSLKNL